MNINLKSIVFFIALSFCNSFSISAQSIENLDRLNGFFNLKFGDPKSKLNPYILPGQPSEYKYVELDLTKDSSFREAFNQPLKEVFLSFDENELLNKISFAYARISNNDEKAHLERLNAIGNDLINRFGMFTEKLQNGYGFTLFWKGKNIMVWYEARQKFNEWRYYVMIEKQN